MGYKYNYSYPDSRHVFCYIYLLNTPAYYIQRGMTNYHIGPHRTTWDYIGAHRTTSDHTGTHRATSNHAVGRELLVLIVGHRGTDTMDPTIACWTLDCVRRAVLVAEDARKNHFSSRHHDKAAINNTYDRFCGYITVRLHRELPISACLGCRELP